MPILIVVPGGIRNCSIETGSLVFAVFNCVITGLASIALAIHALIHGYHGPQYGLPDYIVASANVGVIALSILAFSFSVLLARGLLQRRPSLVKAYVLFGLVILTLCLVISVTMFVRSGDNEHENACISAATAIICASKFLLQSCACFLFCAGLTEFHTIVYAAILLMIWATYKKLLDAVQYQ